jgi:mannose-6-phosphate isomerase-like protein (cupin superfamily)
LLDPVKGGRNGFRSSPDRITGPLPVSVPVMRHLQTDMVPFLRHMVEGEMAERGDAFYNPVTRTRVVFLTVPADNGGREMVIDWYVPPGEMLPAAKHYHGGPANAIVERFDILSGTTTCWIGSEKRTVSAPALIEIPFNVVHVHPRNVGSETLHVRQSPWVAPEPSLVLLTRIERYFETLIALSQKGKVNRKGDFTDPLQSALTIHETLLDPSFLPVMPESVQKALFGSMAGLARRLGYQACYRPQKEGETPAYGGHGATLKAS